MASQTATADADIRLNVIVPLAAGGALDRFARTVEQFLPNVADIDVAVENYSPKNGEDGYQEFMRRPADGSTVLAWFEPAAAAYQPEISLDDLAIINVQEIEPPILVASRETGWRDLQDMMTAVRKAPNDYRLGIGGRTGGGALLTSALLTNLDLELTEITYGSGGKARKGLARGEVDLTAGSINAVRKLGDKVTALAVFSPRRLRSWPGVPTLREALGVEADQGVTGAVYRFFAVHRRFAEDNPEAFQALVERFRRMTEDDEGFRENASEGRVGAHWFGPTESTSLIQRSHQHFRKLIADLPDR
ncbi:MAG: tripartite tricarboxylate transporter substrate-binding protein [Pseudomonadota bacterium]